ncbi:hypothetical protein JKF63_01948 [Porcisia hertigi]|uniref:Uncharacterized protein n=1 Tax=Porcisia hertigi TaxID=2761500 RepID=A0A836IGQ2_9TRYP|nr:hypothetical protein JKF63_01948 [Porcisia hertigi]
MAVAPQVSQRQEALKHPKSLPYNVLAGMLPDIQEQLQQERRAFCQEKKEFEHLQLRLAQLDKKLEVAQRQQEQHRQHAVQSAYAAARTSRLSRVAQCRRREYEEAIMRTANEIRQIRRSSRDGAFFRKSSSAISPGTDVSSSYSSAQPHMSVVAEAAVRTISAPELSRAAAAAREVNEEQQQSALVHALEIRVAQVERENRILQSHIDVLNRGDASSVKLYHDLESHYPLLCT